MKQITKRVMSVALTLIMLLSILPTTVLAKQTPRETQTCKFQILYVDDSNIGYNCGNSWDVKYTCQYTTKHLGFKHSMACSVIENQVNVAKTKVDDGYDIVGWAKDAKQNPTVLTTYTGNTTTFTIDTIYLVAKKAAPTTKVVKINYFDEAAKKQAAEVPVELAADATEVPATLISEKLPDGYKLKNALTNVAIADGYAYVAVEKIPTTQIVKINYFDEAAKKQAAEVPVELAADATEVPATLISEKLPDGYKLKNALTNVAIADGYAYVAVEKIPTTQIVKINYFDEAAKKQAAEVPVELAADATEVPATLISEKLPDGYKLKNALTNVAIADGYAYVAVEKIPTTQIVKINYFDEAAKKQAAEVPVELAADATEVPATLISEKLPDGYKLKNALTNVAIADGYAYVAVEKIPTTQIVKINYFDEAAKKQAAEVPVELAADATEVPATLISEKLPDGYKLKNALTNVAIADGYAYVAVEKIPTTQIVKINYFDEAAKKQAAEVPVELAADATEVPATLISEKLPDGYKLKNALTNVAIADGYAYVAVEKIPTTQIVKINYFDEAAKKQAAEVPVELAADATEVPATLISEKLPDGYKLKNALTNVAIADGYAYVAVEKIPTTQIVKINYFDEAAYKQVAEEELEVSADATYVKTSALKAPEGYELVLAGDLPIRDGYVYAAVRKVAPTTKVVKINYFDEAAYKQVAEEELEVSADATYVKTSALKAPEGYELVLAGDLPIRDGYVYAAVRKVAPTTKVVKINYFDEAAYKQVAEEELEVSADATYVNTSALKAPEGYELILSGDLPIRDGYVYAAVRKVAPTTKVVKINYFDEAAYKQVAEEELEVSADATYVNTSALKAPEGYELILSGDLPIRDGYVYVSVKKAAVTENVIITFKVVNGTWADGSNTDKTVEIDKGAVLNSDQIPTGMKANSGYKTGAWSADLTGKQDQDATYTYKFEKESSSSSSSGSSSRTSKKYTLKYDTNDGKKISSESKSKKWTKDFEGLPVPTKKGYEFAGWYYNEKLTKKVKTDVDVDATTVILYAKWVEASELPFTDVDVNDSYYEAVKYCYDNNIFKGTTDTTFAPYSTLTRGQMVTVLWRLNGSPEPEHANPFTDVAATSPFAKAIAWAAENKLTNGVTETTFVPNQAISRQQFLTILYRYAVAMQYDVTVKNADEVLADYPDAENVSAYAVPAMQWAISTGVAGAVDGMLAPTDPAPRYQVAEFLANFCQEVVSR